MKGTHIMHSGEIAVIVGTLSILIYIGIQSDLRLKRKLECLFDKEAPIRHRFEDLISLTLGAVDSDNVRVDKTYGNRTDGNSVTQILNEDGDEKYLITTYKYILNEGNRYFEEYDFIVRYLEGGISKVKLIYRSEKGYTIEHYVKNNDYEAFAEVVGELEKVLKENQKLKTEKELAEKAEQGKGKTELVNRLSK